MKTGFDINEAIKYYADTLRLAVKKNKDYSSKGMDPIKLTGMEGVSVRLIDKVTRLYNLVKSKDPPNYESIDDTLRDISNYALIGYLLKNGKWGEGEKDYEMEKS